MKGLIKVGYSCNEHCTFCHTRDVRHIDGTSAEVEAKIRRAKVLGYRMVVLSGGEATIRPELFDWAALIVSLDMDLGLVTNGQMLAYPEFLQRLLDHRLRYVYMSLHGGNAKVHNALVRSHGFDNALQALRNLQGKGLEVTVNTVVTRQNVEHLKGVVDLILQFPEVRLKFSMVEPKGGGNRLFRQLTPSVSLVAQKVREAIEYGVEKAGNRGPRFAHDGIPLCLLPGIEGWFDDLKTHRYATMTDIGERDFHPVDERAKLHPPPCRGCSLRGPCGGLFKGYHAAFGHEELRPVGDRPRSNSFTWTLEGLVGSDIPEDRCPLWSMGTTPWDRGRTLFVRNGQRVARYRSETRDFGDSEIESIKHELGQVYFDRSRKTAPDNFAADLIQLRLSKLCHSCPEKPQCTGMFEPVFEDVFSRDDQRVRELLGQLSGEVLDVGCGEGPYEDIWEPLATSGVVKYTGLEPEGSRVAMLRKRWPWGRILEAGAEDLEEALSRNLEGLAEEGDAAPDSERNAAVGSALLSESRLKAELAGGMDSGLDSELDSDHGPGPLSAVNPELTGDSDAGRKLELGDAKSELRSGFNRRSESEQTTTNASKKKLFDHILILRSWNHLRDPRKALSQLMGRLRPGGTLVVVDNVAFGLARTAQQTSRAHSSKSGFEHYRNDGAEEAHELLSEFPLRLSERWDVGPGTSNQWLLRYVREGSED